jgi:adenosylcobinamide-phosphate synthase
MTWLEPRLNRPRRSAPTRIVRGLAATAIVSAVFAAAALGAVWMAATFSYGWVAALAMMIALLDGGAALDEAARVARALRAGDLLAARATAAGTLGPAARGMDRLELVAALTRRLGWRICAGAVAPAAWFAVLGLPGLAIYRALAAVAAAWANLDSPRRAFAYLPLRLHELAALGPAVAAGLLIVAACLFAPGGRAIKAATTWARGPAGPAFSRDWVEAVMASALAPPSTARLPSVAASVNALRAVVYLGALVLAFAIALVALAGLNDVPLARASV